jgi:hypothetical protein
MGNISMTACFNGVRVRLLNVRHRNQHIGFAANDMIIFGNPCRFAKVRRGVGNIFSALGRGRG